MRGECRRALDQRVEILRVERQQLRLAHRRDGAAALGTVQQRDLAEETAIGKPHLLVGNSISTSPAVMKYIDAAGSPRRTRISPVSMVWARNSRMMSAISAARRCANSGTRASMPQVTTKS